MHSHIAVSSNVCVPVVTDFVLSHLELLANLKLSDVNVVDDTFSLSSSLRPPGISSEATKKHAPIVPTFRYFQAGAN